MRIIQSYGTATFVMNDTTTALLRSVKSGVPIYSFCALAHDLAVGRRCSVETIRRFVGEEPSGIPRRSSPKTATATATARRLSVASIGSRKCAHAGRGRKTNRFVGKIEAARKLAEIER